MLPTRLLGVPTSICLRLLAALALTLGLLAALPSATHAAPSHADRLQVRSVQAASYTKAHRGTWVRTDFVVRNRTGARTGRALAHVSLRDREGTIRGLTTAVVAPVAAGRDERITVRARVSPRTAPGRYFVTVCLTPRPDGRCRTSRRASVVVAETMLATADTLDLGPAGVGLTGDPRVLVVRNAGDSNAGRIDTAVTGPFRRSGGTCGPPLLVDETCTVEVVLEPSAAGEAVGTLVVSGRRSGRTAVDLHGQGVAGALTVTDVDFANRFRGNGPFLAEATVTNVGSGRTAPLVATFEGDDELAVESTTCDTLAPGESCAVTLTYSPVDAEPDDGVLTVGDGQIGASGAVSGTPVSAVSSQPADLDLGDVLVGGSSVGLVTFANAGSTDLEIAAPVIAGDDFASGAADDPASCAALAAGSGRLPAHGSCTVEVRFSPTGTDPAHGSVTLTGPAVDAVSDLVAQGLPTPAALAADDESWHFGAVGPRTAAHTVTITNTGMSPTGSLDAEITGPDAASFDLTTACSELAGGASCTVHVVFAPTGVGARSAVLRVGDGAAGVEVTLTGSAAVGLVVDPSSVSFGDTPVGASSTSEVVTVSNDTDHAEALDVHGVTGPFVVAGGTCAAGDWLVPAQGSCTVELVFSPVLEGPAEGSLVLGNDVYDLSVDLSGDTPPALLVADDTSWNFGSAAARRPEHTFTVTNAGGTTIAAPVTIAGASAGQFESTSTCATVAPGGSCSVTVTFAPTGTGARAAVLSVGDGPGAATVQLSGTAAVGITVSAPTLDLGDWVKDTERPVLLTLANDTDVAEALNVAFSGSSLASPLGGTCLAAGFVVPAHGSCTVTSSLKLDVLGVKTSSVRFSNDGYSVTSSISGIGAPVDQRSASPALTDFGSVPVGTTSTPRVVLVHNPTGTTQTLQSITYSGGYSIAGGASTCFTQAGVLPPHTACTLAITFGPTQARVYDVTFTLDFDDSFRPTFAVTGRGIDPAARAPRRTSSTETEPGRERTLLLTR